MVSSHVSDRETKLHGHILVETGLSQNMDDELHNILHDNINNVKCQMRYLMKLHEQKFVNFFSSYELCDCILHFPTSHENYVWRLFFSVVLPGVRE